MSHQEKLINGIAYWRKNPIGEWKPFSIEDLSERYFEQKKEMNKIYLEWGEQKHKVDTIWNLRVQNPYRQRFLKIIRPEVLQMNWRLLQTI